LSITNGYIIRFAKTTTPVETKTCNFKGIALTSQLTKKTEESVITNPKNLSLDLSGKTLKTTGRIEMIYSDIMFVGDKCFMFSKPHINNVSVVLYGLSYVRGSKVLVVLYVIYLPYNIITFVKATEYFIQTFKAGTCP
jgi:hypothetical protein